MTPEEFQKFSEDLLRRQAMLERRFHLLEASIPRQISAALGMFFKAAADARNKPDQFEFALFSEGNDPASSLRLVYAGGKLEPFSYVGDDHWVPATWIMPDSIIWRMAEKFMSDHNLADAQVVIVTTVNQETPPDGERENKEA